jgi:prevent-host-death family protein
MIRPSTPQDIDKVATSSYLCGMRVVGIKVLKNKLSEYVRIAASGEVVLVTDRDKVVAELIPPRAEHGRTLAEAQLADAIQRGHVRPPLATRTGPPTSTPVAPLETLLDELARDREDR